MSSDEPKLPAEPSAQPEQTSEVAAASTVGGAASGAVVGFAITGPVGAVLGATVGYLLGGDSLIARGDRSETPAATITSSSQEVLPVAGRTDEELARELVELEKPFAEPDVNAIRADAKWFDDHGGKPALTQYRGSFVAVLNGAVVGHGANALQLQIDVTRKFNVHPQRFIIEYIPHPTF